MGSSHSIDFHKDENLTAILTFVFLVFSLIWCFRNWRKASRNATPPLPPGPQGLPLLGYLPFLGADLHLQFKEMAKVYGPIYKLQLGTKLCIVVSSPELVKQVVRDHDRTFSDRDPTIAAAIVTYGASDIGFQSYGTEWKKLRKLFVSQLMSRTSLDGCYSLRKEELHKSISRIYHEKIGTPTDISQVAFSTAINTTMRMLWGSTLQGDKGTIFAENYRKLVAEQIELVAKPNISDYFPLLARIDIQGIGKQAKKVQSDLDKFLSWAIEDKIKKLACSMATAENGTSYGKPGRKDFLHLLLENSNIYKDDSMSLTPTQVKALLTNIIVGGTDTVATMMEWVMTELLHHPEEMRRVQQELTEIVGLDKLVEETHLPKLRHLDAVIKETLRLHPALPLLVPRQSNQSTIVGGYHIPKDSTVFINVYAIHRDSRVWDNPLEFLPQRFLDTDPSKSFNYQGNEFKYLPFGSGRRICAGLPLAERMLLYIVASFLHSFEWTLPCDEKLELSDKFGIVIKKKTPLISVPTARLSNLELYG